MTFPLSFSKKMLEKFGNTVFPELAKRVRTQQAFYRLKSKEGYAVNVNTWLKGMTYSKEVKKIVQENKWDTIQNDDTTVYKILKWVKDNITYKSDSLTHMQTEYWQTADETLELRTGDCEDGAILILILAYFAGMNMQKISLTWGKVIGGGHAYVTYLRDEDGVEVVLDWCYWYTNLIVKFRKWFGLEENYIAVWGRAWL